MSSTCACGRRLYEPDGPAKARLVIVGEAPGFDQYNRNSNGVFTKTAENILIAELGKVGIPYYDCRRTLFYKHAVTKECEASNHKDVLAKELASAKVVLIMGSKAVREMLGVDDDDYYSLTVYNPALPCAFVVAPNVYHIPTGVLGEFRLAMKRLKENT